MELTAARRAHRAETLSAARLSEIFAGAAIFAFSLLLLRGWLEGGVPLTPRREMLAQMAWAGLAVEALGNGQWPAEWSPWFLGGQPWTRLLSVPVYLLVALLSFLPGVGLAGAVKLFYLGAFALSGWTMYGWVRSLRVGVGPALMAAAAYQFFPFHAQAGADWWEHLLVWALLPLPLWAVERWRWTWNWRRGAALGAAVGALVLVNPERAPHNAFFLGLYILARELRGWRAGRTVVGRSMGALALAGVVAVALAAPLLISVVLSLPALGASLMRGPEATLSSDFLRGWSLTPELLGAAVLRRAKLDPATAGLPAIWKAFGGLNAWYLGVGLVGMALSGLVALRRTGEPHRRELVALLWGLVILALLVGMSPWLPGDPFHLIFARILPYRAIFYLGLFLPALAALALEQGTQAAQRLVARIRPRQAGMVGIIVPALALGVVLVDFAPVSASYGTASAYFSPDEVAAYGWLAEQQVHGPWRVWEPTDAINAKYHRTLAPTVAPVPRFDGHWDEGVPRPLWELRHTTGSDELPALLDLLAVRYIMLRPAEAGAPRWQATLAGAGWERLAWEQGEVQIWENPRVSPYARLDGAALVRRDEAGDLRVRVEMASTGALMLAEAWYPDWTVRVDGQPAEVVRSGPEGAFLGVQLPEGRHEVLFQWTMPLPLRAAWIVAALTVALLLLAWRWPT